MAERATGISTANANEYVATFTASEEAEGQTRLIQIISLAGGKIEAAKPSAMRSVSSDDSYDLTTVSGDLLLGDNAFIACYTEHSELTGNCLITPLLCDNDGVVMGVMPTKKSQVSLPVYGSSNYYSNCLSWEVRETGAWKAYLHVSALSDSNTVELRYFSF